MDAKNGGMSWKQLMAVLSLFVLMFSTALTVTTYYNVSAVDRLESSLGGRMDRLESSLGGRMDRLESKVDGLDERLDGLSNEVAEIKGALRAKGIIASK